MPNIAGDSVAQNRKNSRPLCPTRGAYTRAKRRPLKSRPARACRPPRGGSGRMDRRAHLVTSCHPWSRHSASGTASQLSCWAAGSAKAPLPVWAPAPRDHVDCEPWRESARSSASQRTRPTGARVQCAPVLRAEARAEMAACADARAGGARAANAASLQARRQGWKSLQARAGPISRPVQEVQGSSCHPKLIGSTAAGRGCRRGFRHAQGARLPAVHVRHRCLPAHDCQARGAVKAELEKMSATPFRPLPSSSALLCAAAAIARGPARAPRRRDAHVRAHGALPLRWCCPGAACRLASELSTSSVDALAPRASMRSA